MGKSVPPAGSRFRPPLPRGGDSGLWPAGAMDHLEGRRAPLGLWRVAAPLGWALGLGTLGAVGHWDWGLKH